MKQAQEHLNDKGIHASMQRIAIMDYLLKHRTHPTADEIFSALNPSIPTLSKTTVYNTLKLFEEKEAVLVLNIDEKNLRYDAFTDSHAHFRCRCCGRIFDLPLNESDSIASEGFKIEVTHVYHKGICPHCDN